MIIECEHCNARVDAKVLAEYDVPPSPDSLPYKYAFVLCPLCETPHVGQAEQIQVGSDEYEWSHLDRLWPNPPKNLDRKVPRVVRDSMEEAERCFRSRAYKGCAVMTGRALEGICSSILEKNRITISAGIKELKSRGVIDPRLFDWAESLRKERNIGAHAWEETTSKEDARDLLEFANAIIEYIYVLSARYEEYKKRKEGRKKFDELLKS
jgi:hypothetical protein